jgi:hypothetical protein
MSFPNLWAAVSPSFDLTELFDHLLAKLRKIELRKRLGSSSIDSRVLAAIGDNFRGSMFATAEYLSGR